MKNPKALCDPGLPVLACLTARGIHFLDFDAFAYELDGLAIQKYFVDSPIGQHPDMNYEAWWHVLVKNEGGAYQQMDQPTFNIEVTNTPVSVSRSSGNPGTETFNGDVLTLVLSPLYGDFNHDGVVSSTDMLTIIGQYGVDVTAVNQHLDFDNNGLIGVQDLQAFLTYFGSSFPDNLFGGYGTSDPFAGSICTPYNLFPPYHRSQS